MSPPSQAIAWDDVFNYFHEKGYKIEEIARLTLGQIRSLTGTKESPVQYKTLDQAMKAALAAKSARGEA